MPLPSNCAACVYHQRDGSLCRRHAPGPGYEEMEVTHWAVVKSTDRCGSGEIVGDGTTSPVSCARCVHWLQPKSRTLNPALMRGMSAEWWRGSGLCTRFPPSPAGEERRESFWRITHGENDKCGDGISIDEFA